MADSDEHFRMGVQHGLDDEPVYRWQDPVYQERYDAGYAVGQCQRMKARAAAAQLREFVAGTQPQRLRWADYEAMLRRRGLA